MTRIFLDSDVILDFLAEREPHYDSAARVFLKIQKREYVAVTTPIVYANLFYLLGRRFRPAQAILLLRKLRLLLGVVSVDEETVEEALASEFKDFEDALQYYAALSGKVDVLLTRNKKDYRLAKDVTVLSPAEFLSFQK